MVLIHNNTVWPERLVETMLGEMTIVREIKIQYISF